MIVFQIFHIKKLLREAKENPSALAGEQVTEVLWGIILIPLIIAIIGITLFFVIGYTHWFGFQFGFFKFLFWLSLVVSTIIFLVIRKIISSLRASTTIHTKSILKNLKINSAKEEEMV